MKDLINEMLINHKNKRKKTALIVVLSCAVIVAITSMLSLTGRALTGQTRELSCSYAVHQHTEKCYGSDHDLICGYADYVIHEHDENCYDGNGELVCELPEVKPHKHDSSCYERVKEPACGLEESEGHSHTEECFDEDGTLVCKLEESEGHQHTEECYPLSNIPSCGKQELHTHTDQCYETNEDGEKVLACGLLELKEHVHDDSCFTEIEVRQPDEKQPAKEPESEGTSSGQENMEEPDTGNIDNIPGDTSTVGTPGSDSTEPSDGENGTSPAPENADEGPIVYFTFDGDCDNHGTVAGITASWDGDDSYTSGDDAMNGKAASFKNGSIQLSGLDVGQFSNNEGATVSFWCKGTNGWPYYWGNRGTEHYTGVEYADQITGKYHKNAHNNAVAEGVPKDGWHLITMTYSSIPDSMLRTLSMTLYVDGAPVVTKRNLTSFFNETPIDFLIGDNGSGGRFDGIIDEFKIYNRALTSEEISGLIEPAPAVVWFDSTCGNASADMPYYSATNRLAHSINDFKTDENGVKCVQLPTGAGETSYYEYQLAGWYDIYAQKYYKPGDLVPVTELGNGQTGHDTVFYADWWAKDYSLEDATKAAAENSRFVSADAFVSTDVYDYNDIYNTACATLTKGQLDANGHSESWGDSHTHIAFDNWQASGSLQSLTGRDSGNTNHEATSWFSTNEQKFLGIATQGLFEARHAASLFPAKDGLGINYLGKGRSLFQYEPSTGYYYYDSKVSAAAYDQNAQRFHVYDSSEKINDGSSTSDFLPLNSGKTSYARGEVNYWFGLSSTVSFNLPGDVATDASAAANDKKNQGEFGKDMCFTFSGDDDAWVFVDGQLVLDMGGIHDVVFGSIDFSTGEVILGDNGATVRNPTYYRTNPGTPPSVLSGAKHIAEAETFIKGLGAGAHTLTIYYLERGAGQSNCAVYFNLSPSAGIEIEKKDAVTHGLLEGAGFTLKNSQGQYYKLNGKGQVEWGDDPQTFYTDANGRLKFSSIPVGTYTLNESEAPVGHQLDSRDITVKVSHKAGTRDDFDFEVDSETNVTYDDDQTTLTIHFTNQPEYYPLRVVKHGEGNRPLEGAVFELYSKSDGENRVLLGTLQSKADGMLAFTEQEDAAQGLCQSGKDGTLQGLLTGQSYFLKETEAPAGYQALLYMVGFHITKDGIILDGSPEGVAVGSIGNDSVLILTDPQTTVKVAFLKESFQDRQPLAGAEFKLYGSDYLDVFGNANSSAKALWSGTSVIDKNGQPAWEGGFGKFPQLTAGQTYYLVETKAPAGYELLESPIRITVARNGTVSAGFVGSRDVAIEEITDGDARISEWMKDVDGHLAYDYVFAVPNVSGSALPETGGFGSLPFYGIALAIFLMAGWMLYREDKKQSLHFHE